MNSHNHQYEQRSQQTDGPSAEADSAAPVEEIGATAVKDERNYSTDWDPTRAAPQPGSRPEAPNFPQQQYEMSRDHSLFQAPPPPEPPNELHYGKPKPSLKPIFPWEKQARTPTRVFAQEPEPTHPPPPEPSPPLVKDPMAGADVTASPPSPQPQAPSSPFSSFTTANAWDNDPLIERYVSAMPQNHRSAKPQSMLSQTTPLVSPPLPDFKHERRPSRITDFPTEVERPSLPVTPAPVHRPSFWGSERDESGALPQAEGVPEQSDWDPVARLQELHKKQSEMLGSEKEGENRPIPHRDSVSSTSVLKPIRPPTRTSPLTESTEAAPPLSSSTEEQNVQKTTFKPLESTSTKTAATQKTSFTPLAPEIEDPPSAAKDIVEKLQQESKTAAPPPFTASASAAATAAPTAS